MDLYFFKKAPRYTIDVSKVARVYEFLKGRVAVWIQPLIEDYLTNKGAYKDLNECKKETRELFSSWDDFKDNMTVMFREINQERLANQKLSRAHQTTSVQQYTAYFKQLQA